VPATNSSAGNARDITTRGPMSRACSIAATSDVFPPPVGPHHDGIPAGTDRDE